ncbi:hypothetical protein KI387_034309, partial [Taxus chinensis]
RITSMCIFEIEDDDVISNSFDEVGSKLSQNSSPDNTPVMNPASLNAFDIISFSRGFDLSDCKIKMQGSKDGRKGNLVISAEIFEVTPYFFVVELRKASGDTIEYEEFCNQELKPGLKDI